MDPGNQISVIAYPMCPDSQKHSSSRLRSHWELTPTQLLNLHITYKCVYICVCVCVCVCIAHFGSSAVARLFIQED
jgi:hypothetical protein